MKKPLLTLLCSLAIMLSGCDPITMNETDITPIPTHTDDVLSEGDQLIKVDATNELGDELTPMPDDDIDEFNMDYARGLFSWDADAFRDHNRSDMMVVMNHLGIDELYQDFDDREVDDEHAGRLARDLSLLDIDLYILVGAREWTYEADGAPMLDVIQRAVEFQEQWGADRLKGIVFDIEPYASKRWKDGDRHILMDNYVKGMQIAYQEARTQDLRVILCIPTWYEKHYPEFFKDLMQYCDEFCVMNYIRADEYENIIDEIEYARQRDMDITCIFEFQRIGKHDLSADNTYNHLGLDAAQDSFEHLYQRAGYDRLKFAYHYLKPIAEMMLDESGD